MSSKHDLSAILMRHLGRGNGITAKQLAAQLDVPPRWIRHLITELREDGVAVCGHPSSGYFIAENDAELEETCEFLYHRAMHSLSLIAKFKNVALPELRGQLRLKT